MGTHAPEMPILVDDETGVWTTDALPMLYVPRHFFVNNHMGIEEEIGAERYAEILPIRRPQRNAEIVLIPKPQRNAWLLSLGKA